MNLSFLQRPNVKYVIEECEAGVVGLWGNRGVRVTSIGLVAEYLIAPIEDHGYIACKPDIIEIMHSPIMYLG